ncbi:DHS-like NAD/FAD-binding domain-containing protein [Fomitopsis serialis]|uniref:DHS-like NAD/FAD-binding domain-containing protein n=1 Tax=Fomitopsis serialis TaxID=139415 RepID=UPI002008BE96|nr:DHS-like NAD/FAD-binding domain-containing protein [Neoantrodia serialis]KAH9913192.1 DHS-like NAD/FAD-binding domain-containing protein [Neoantrodia serialis]
MPITLDLDECSSDVSMRRSLSNLSLSVAKCKKILVVTGAGISCSCGIPDFRSSDGLYALVKQQYPGIVLKGRDLFDASLFRDPISTSVFYTFISQLKRSINNASPSPTHRFLKTLDTKRKLLRSYTQNIDALEEKAGLLGSSSNHVKNDGKGKTKIKVRDVRNVQLHGDIHRVRCTFCSADFPCNLEYMNTFDTGAAPDCPECVTRSIDRVARSARPLKVGTLRPAIVLYNEPHPLGDDIASMQSADMTRKPDMLIIMGTSLKVHGFKKLVRDFAKIVHESAPSPAVASTSSQKNTKAFAGKVIFVNKTAPSSEWDGIIDYHIVGETDKWAETVVEEWKRMWPSDWEVQKKLTTAGDVETAGMFKVTKEITNTFDGMKSKGMSLAAALMEKTHGQSPR